MKDHTCNDSSNSATPQATPNTPFNNYHLNYLHALDQLTLEMRKGNVNLCNLGAELIRIQEAIQDTDSRHRAVREFGGTI